MKLTFLGTSAGTPTPKRGVSALALHLPGQQPEIWLFDCGEGTQRQLLHAGINPHKVRRIFITHLHGDHIFGLPGFVTTRSMGSNPLPLALYGPSGLNDYVSSTLHLSNSHLTYALTVNEISPGYIINNRTASVQAGWLAHRVPSLGYRISPKPLPQALDSERLAADGIAPGAHLQQLKAGKTAILPDGRRVCGIDYLLPAQRVKTVAIFGDTSQTLAALALAQNADVLVHEATFEASLADKASERGHSTTAQAAEIARSSHAKKLIVTHLSARYGAADEARLLAECRAIFPNTVIAHDFDTVLI